MVRSQSQPCYEPAVLEAFLAETLDEAHETQVQAHIEGCTKCQSALERVAGDPESWSSVRKHLASAQDALPGTLPATLEEALQETEASAHELDEWQALLDRSDDPEKLGRIGVYEIIGLIGRGTTGLVWKAFEPRLNRFVALKILSPTYQANGSARQRFAREGRAVAAVSHEHVVPVYAVDDHRGLPYIVMKYIPGLSLEQRIQRDGPLDTCEVARIGLQVAQGLAAAHEQGIIHRDVKPANVILEDTVERAMVTDFGLARVADEAAMTSSGTISGTPHYMSPEQARGQTVDQRSDLFSLGSLLYAACAGRPPFRAENVFGVIHRVCKTEPRPIHEIQASIAPWLEAFISKLMAKAPENRFQSADEVVRALSAELAYLQNPSSAPQPARPWVPSGHEPAGHKRLAKRAWGAALAAAAALALGTWGWRSQPWGTTEENSNSDQGPTLQASFLPSLEHFVGQGTSSEALSEPVRVADGWTRRDRIEVDPRFEANGALPIFERVERKVLPAQGLRTLEISIHRGHVQVLPGSGSEVRVTTVARVAAANLGQAQAALDGPTLEPVFLDDRVILSNRGEAPDTSAPLHSLRLEVPPHLAATLDTGNGNVDITGLSGDVEARARGHLRAGRLTGAIDLRTEGGHIDFWGQNQEKAQLLAIGGNIHVHGATAGARARTSNGHVFVGRNAGEVYAQTSGGHLYVQELQGWVGGHAGGGNVYLLVTQTPGDTCSLSAAGGHVYVLLGPDVEGTLRVRGRIESDLTFVTETSKGGNEPFQTAQLGAGGPLLQFASPAGRIVIDTMVTQDPRAPLSPRMAQAVGESPSGKGHARDANVASGGESSNASATSGGGSGIASAGIPSGGSSAGSSDALGGSGASLSGSPQSSLGGSGSSHSIDPRLTRPAPNRLSETPAAGRLATVHLENPGGNIDGYTLYLPRSFDEHEGTYPILVYLQGAYGVGGEVRDLNHWGLPRLLRDETDMSLERNRLLLDRFVVVNLHIRHGQYHQQPQLIRTILQRMADEYKGDLQRVYLTGLSRGGHASWALPHLLPGTFAAVAPVGGDAEDIESFQELAQTAVWVAHNQADNTVPFEEAERAIQAVQAITGELFLRSTPRDIETSGYLDHRYVLTSSPSGGHDAWTDLYTSAAFYRWLLRQRLP